MKAKESYPAIINSINEDTALCHVQIGEVELALCFPLKVLAAHGLNHHDRFRWTPTEDGSVSPKDIQPIERRGERRKFPRLSDDVIMSLKQTKDRSQ